MTLAEKRQRIGTARARILDNGWDRSPGKQGMDALQGMGFSARFAPTTNRLSYAGITALCTWSETAGLISAWSRAAERFLEKTAP